MAVAESAAEPGSEKLGLFHQLVRFGLIGGVCAVIDLGTYMLLLQGLEWPNFVARPLAFVLGTGTSYVANRKLTFTGAGKGNTTAKAGAFALVYIVTFFVNNGTNQLLYVSLPEFTVVYGDSLRAFVCWFIGQGLGTGINFVMLKWVVFKD